MVSEQVNCGLPGVGEDWAEFTFSQKFSGNEKHSEEVELFMEPYF